MNDKELNNRKLHDIDQKEINKKKLGGRGVLLYLLFLFPSCKDFKGFYR